MPVLLDVKVEWAGGKKNTDLVSWYFDLVKRNSGMVKDAISSVYWHFSASSDFIISLILVMFTKKWVAEL